MHRQTPCTAMHVFKASDCYILQHPPFSICLTLFCSCFCLFCVQKNESFGLFDYFLRKDKTRAGFNGVCLQSQLLGRSLGPGSSRPVREMLRVSNSKKKKKGERESKRTDREMRQSESKRDPPLNFERKQEAYMAIDSRWLLGIHFSVNGKQGIIQRQSAVKGKSSEAWKQFQFSEVFYK